MVSNNTCVLGRGELNFCVHSPQMRGISYKPSPFGKAFFSVCTTLVTRNANLVVNLVQAAFRYQQAVFSQGHVKCKASSRQVGVVEGHIYDRSL